MLYLYKFCLTQLLCDYKAKQDKGIIKPAAFKKYIRYEYNTQRCGNKEVGKLLIAIWMYRYGNLHIEFITE